MIQWQILNQLRKQADQIRTLQSSVEEFKGQNGAMIKTMRDVHLVLKTILDQGTEQRGDIYELRKRITDFHEDMVGKMLYSRSAEEASFVESSSGYSSAISIDDNLDELEHQPIAANTESRRYSRK